MDSHTTGSATGKTDQHPLGREVHVPHRQVGEFARTETRVEQHEDQALVTSPFSGASVAVPEEQLDVVRRKRLHVPLRDLPLGNSGDSGAPNVTEELLDIGRPEETRVVR